MPRSCLLSGGQRQHHGYRDQAFYLAEALEDTGRYEVTMGEDAAILETPAIGKYDLIIVNADRRDPEFKFTKAQQQALLDYVQLGPRLRLDPRRRQRRARLAPRLAGDARRRLLARRAARRQGPQGDVHRQDRRHRPARSPRASSDFALKDELYYNLQMLPGVRAAGHHRVRGRAPGRSPGPGPTARAASSTPRSATATSAPARTTPSATRTSAG